MSYNSKILGLDISALDKFERNYIYSLFFQGYHADVVMNKANSNGHTLDVCVRPVQIGEQYHIRSVNIKYLEYDGADIRGRLNIDMQLGFVQTLIELLNDKRVKKNYTEGFERGDVEYALKASTVKTLSGNIYSKKQAEFIANMLIDIVFIKDLRNRLRETGFGTERVLSQKFKVAPMIDSYNILTAVKEILVKNDLDFKDGSISITDNAFFISNEESLYGKWFSDVLRGNNKIGEKPPYPGFFEKMDQTFAFKKIFDKSKDEDLSLEF